MAYKLNGGYTEMSLSYDNQNYGKRTLCHGKSLQSALLWQMAS